MSQHKRKCFLLLTQNQLLAGSPLSGTSGASSQMPSTSHAMKAAHAALSLSLTPVLLVAVIIPGQIQRAVAERHGLAEVNRLLTPDLYVPPGVNDTGALQVQRG